jgi:hypothetical protein
MLIFIVQHELLTGQVTKIFTEYMTCIMFVTSIYTFGLFTYFKVTSPSSKSNKNITILPHFSLTQKDCFMTNLCKFELLNLNLILAQLEVIKIKNTAPKDQSCNVLVEHPLLNKKLLATVTRMFIIATVTRMSVPNSFETKMMCVKQT